jgi:flagellar protein FlaG
MDINALQQKSAAITPLKLVDTKQPVSSSAKSVDDATQKTKTPLEPTDVASVAKAKESKKPDDLQQAVSLLNDYVQNMQRDLQFSIDKESGVLVVKVIDTKSEKVIRQIPNEETLKMARSLAEHNNEASFSIFSSRA